MCKFTPFYSYYCNDIALIIAKNEQNINWCFRHNAPISYRCMQAIDNQWLFRLDNYYNAMH